MPCFDGGGPQDYGKDYSNEIRQQNKKLHDLDDKHHKALDKIQSQEEELCDLRNMMVQILEGKEIDPKKLGKLKSFVKENQLKHRKEERDFRVAYIRKEHKILKENVRKIEELGGEPKASTLRTIKKMENEIHRILMLTDEQLLDKENFPF